MVPVEVAPTLSGLPQISQGPLHIDLLTTWGPSGSCPFALLPSLDKPTWILTPVEHLQTDHICGIYIKVLSTPYISRAGRGQPPITKSPNLTFPSIHGCPYSPLHAISRASSFRAMQTTRSKAMAHKIQTITPFSNLNEVTSHSKVTHSPLISHHADTRRPRTSPDYIRSSDWLACKA